MVRRMPMDDQDHTRNGSRPRWRVARAVGIASAAGVLSILWLAVRGLPEPRYVVASAPTEIACSGAPARHVRVVVLRTADMPACIDELEVYAPESDRNVALARLGAVASASSCIPGHASHRIAHLNDGIYGNARSWIAASAPPGEWAQVTMPEPVRVSRVVVSRDRRGEFADRVALHIDVLTSMDGATWEKAGELRGDPAPSGWTASGRSVSFRQEHARFVRLSILGSEGGDPPSLSEVHVYGKEPDVDLADPANGGRVSVSSVADAAGSGRALQDGLLQTRWVAAEPSRQWVLVGLGDRAEVNRLVYARAPDSPAGSAPTAFSVDISLDGRRWKTVAREGWGYVPAPPPPDAQDAAPGMGADAPTRDRLSYANLALP
ncbi:MAG: discoidin domain-containing protein, partial [Armatimonadetes bacterium]|nr:discoidin domain-containing protein [Armatimonadota bacterium]